MIIALTTRTERVALLTTVKTVSAAKRYIEKEQVEATIVETADGPFGRFQVWETRQVCVRSGLLPAKCACQVHAG